MIVEFLGTGTSQGVPVIHCQCKVCVSQDTRDKRLRCSIAIRSMNLTTVVDIGPDFRQQMLRSNIDHISQVLLTHEHNDHVIGMDDLRPYNFRQREDIPVAGMERVLDNVKMKFHYAFEKSPYPGAPGYKLKDIKHGDQWIHDDLMITAFEVMHGNLPILSFRFNDFVYITDAKTVSKESREIIKGCEIMVVNALRHNEHWSHFTLEEALAFIADVKPRKAYLTHVSHLLGTHDEVSKMLPDHVELAYDGLKINI